MSFLTIIFDILRLGELNVNKCLMATFYATVSKLLGTNDEDDFVINSRDFIELKFMSSYLYITN